MSWSVRGSAGCVLANRLTEDGKSTVLLIEAGGSDRSVFLQMPSALAIAMTHRRYGWHYWTEPEPHLDGRRLHCPRGRVLGGSSSVNGMAYVRGNALDYDGWAEGGAPGWSYAEVLPYFRKAENFGGGGDVYRGGSGPLHTRRGAMTNPLYDAFIEAGTQAGYARTADMNGYRQEGFGRMDMTVHRGRRWSTANAYLKPAAARANLAVESDALATRLLLDGLRVRGLEYRQGGAVRTAEARREIVLCGGPVNAPQLLMLSGIGPAGHLREHGIEVVHDLPGVGENLQDHLELYIQQACTKPVTLYSATGPLQKALIGLRWIAFKSGLGATNHFESGGFIRSRPGIRWPDIQYHFLPLAASYDMQHRIRCHGFQAHAGPMRSKSRGTVRLASADPAASPEVRFNYMSHPDDWIDMRSCVRLTREIFAQPAFDLYRGAELAPGEAVQSDEGNRRLRARDGAERVPPHRHLQDGNGRHGGGRSEQPGAGHRGAARRRQLRHADDRHRQPQRADRHDRGEGGRRDPRARAPAAVGSAGLYRARLETRPTLNGFAAQFRKRPDEGLTLLPPDYLPGLPGGRTGGR